MICPKCKKEIKNVVVVSECAQYASVNKKGEITEYGRVEEIHGTISIECNNCATNITKLIKETLNN